MNRFGLSKETKSETTHSPVEPQELLGSYGVRDGRAPTSGTGGLGRQILCDFEGPGGRGGGKEDATHNFHLLKFILYVNPGMKGCLSLLGICPPPEGANESKGKKLDGSLGCFSTQANR